MFRGFLLTALLVFGATSVAARADSLVMFEQKACPYCAAWNRDVGRIYAKTDEAKLLPLRRVDIDASRPRDLRAIAGAYFTPTFVVVHCGREAARITGYISEDQFWGLLDNAIKQLRDDPKGKACPA